MGQYQNTCTKWFFRMGWLTVCLLGMLLVTGNSMPVEEEIEDQEEIRELFTRLFVEEMREGRDLEMEIDNAIEDEDEGENKAIEGALQETNSQEISRFNNYIDAIYKRMNAALRAKLMDPMVLNLQGKDKREGNKKKVKDAKKRVERDVEDEEDIDDSSVNEKEMEDESETDSEVEIDHRAGEPKPKQKGNKKDKKEQKKSLTKKKRQENKLKAKKEREQAKKERAEAKEAKKLAKAAKADKKAAKAAKKNKDQSRESRSRDHGQHHNKRKGGKDLQKGRNGSKNDKKGKKDNKNNNKKGKGSKDHKGSKGKNGSKGKARDNKEADKESKVMGSLAGIATLRRSGDVTGMDEENHKKVESKFTVGPLMLEVSKTIGQGRSRTVRTAKATTDVMTGNMVLKVKPDGSAHVLKVVFAKPDHVDVQGSLSDNKPRSITYLKNSVNRMRPIAAQKILKTARYVLKAPSTVERKKLRRRQKPTLQKQRRIS